MNQEKLLDKPFEICLEKGGQMQFKFQGTFRRINVILGSNGTGKSSVLNTLKANFNQFLIENSSNVIYVEGGRTLAIPCDLAPTGRTVELLSVEKAEKAYAQNKSNKLTTRITAALFALGQRGEEEYRRHSEATMSWLNEEKIGEAPIRKNIPLDDLRDIFQTIFPEITILYDHKTKHIRCVKNESKPYEPTKLSDGEKQIFCLIADLLLLAGNNSLIIVDEPELNLNPTLAVNFWRLIESKLENTIFIYATHCISFTMRKEIETIIVLSKTGASPIQVDDLAELPNDELAPFLGAIPLILTSSRALVIEGEKKSIDIILYKWLIGDMTLIVSEVGSCGNVRSAVKREGVWKALGGTKKIVGVIDRDFRSEEEIRNIEEDGVLILPFHEIEAILCIPELVVKLALTLGLVEKSPTKDNIEKIIFGYWEEEHISCAARITFQEVKFSYAPSLTREEISNIKNDEERIKQAVIKACLDHKHEYFAIRDEAHFKTIFEKNLTICKEALRTKNIDSILRLAPSKPLLNKILPLMGIKRIQDYARAITKNLNPENFEQLKIIRNKIRAKLELEEILASQHFESNILELS